MGPTNGSPPPSPPESTGVPPAAIATLKIGALHDGVPQHVGGPITLTEGQSLRIGRSRSNDLLLPDTKVSRFHAIVSASANGVVISDLASTNGTLVNGARMSAPVDLADGDEIQIGGYGLVVELHHAGDTSFSESARTALSEMLPFEITVLLIDLCGYTSMNQSLPEEDIAEVLGAWLQFSSAIVTRYNGVVDKYIGDCVMSLWRSETRSQKDLAIEAALAGIDIVQSTLEETTFKNWKHAALHPWQCRAVLHSGTALVGNVGGRSNYTVLGDSVNIAFRLEGLADKFKEKFIVSEQTAMLLMPEIPLTNLGRFSLEGRSGMMNVFGRTIP